MEWTFLVQNLSTKYSEYLGNASPERVSEELIDATIVNQPLKNEVFLNFSDEFLRIFTNNRTP